MPWMYILECSDGSLYTGSTAHSDVITRVWEHNNVDEKAAAYTRRRRPVRLRHAEEYDRIDEAYHREKQVQGWSRRKKDALIAERRDDLPELSRNRQHPPGTSTGSVTGSVPPGTSTGSVTGCDDPGPVDP